MKYEMAGVFMSKKAELLKEIETVSEPLLAEVIDFVRFLKMKEGREANYNALMSEPALAKDWDLKEEEDAWRDL
ncbi:MAG: DUF2281 domain-containing protein [Candidatus Riflebacteria bacterium]